MFTATSTLPYSISSLMLNKVAVVTSAFSRRPDRLASIVEGDFYVEAMSNELSNTSALSLKDGDDYYFPSTLYQKYFLGV